MSEPNCLRHTAIKGSKGNPSVCKPLSGCISHQTTAVTCHIHVTAIFFCLFLFYVKEEALLKFLCYKLDIESRLTCCSKTTIS